jgi:G3E family GTPase
MGRWAGSNKTDQLSEKEIRQVTEVIKELNQSAKILHTNFGKLEKDFIRSLSHRRHEQLLLTCPPAEIPTVYIATNNPVDKEFFYKTVDSLKNHILRLKGDVGFDNGSCFMEVVGEQVIEKPACGKFTTRTAFTVIGWKIEKQTLKDAFGKCIIKEMVGISNKMNSGDEK